MIQRTTILFDIPTPETLPCTGFRKRIFMKDMSRKVRCCRLPDANNSLLITFYSEAQDSGEYGREGRAFGPVAG